MNSFLKLSAVLAFWSITSLASDIPIGIGKCDSMSGRFVIGIFNDEEQLKLISQSEAIATIQAVKNCKTQSLSGDANSAICSTSESVAIEGWIVIRSYSSVCKIRCY